MEDELFNEPIDYLTPTYDNHKNNKNIEIEFRIGKLINNRFNTNYSFIITIKRYIKSLLIKKFHNFLYSFLIDN